MTYPGSKDGSFVVALSSFWQSMFRDEGHLLGMYRATEILLGQVYRELLEQALTASLDTTPIFGKDYWREIFLVESDQDIRVTSTGTVYAFPLDDDIVSFRFLQNRVTTPTRIFERDHDFVIQPSGDAYELVFTGGDPFESDDVASVFIQQESSSVLNGKYASVEHGVPDEHLPTTEPDASTAKINRDIVRRTVTIDGVAYETREAEFSNGRDTWLYLPDGEFTSDNAIGKTLRGYHTSGGVLVSEDRTVVGVSQEDVLVMDSAFDPLFAGVTGDGQVKFINTDTFQDEHVGFNLILNDHLDPSHNGTYVIESVTSGLVAVLEKAIVFAAESARLMTLVTRAATTFTVPTGQTRFTDLDVGRSVYVSDTAGVGAWFTIASLATPNPSGFYQDVTVDDPDSETGLLDTASLSMSVRVREPSIQRAAWELKTPVVTRRAHLFAQDLDVDRKYLASRYGALVDRERDSSEAYKQFLQGTLQYYWAGPTHFALLSALNTMGGLPVIEKEGEILLEVTQGATNDTLKTDHRTYTLPAGYLLEALTEASAVRTKVFRKLEAISNAFEVTDLVNDPTWMFGSQIPQAALPDEPESRLLVNPRLAVTSVNGAWKVGDPGVFVGAGADGVVYDDTLIEFDDVTVVGTTVTTTTTKILATYLSKKVYFSGRLRKIVAVLSSLSFSIDTELDAVLLASPDPIDTVIYNRPAMHATVGLVVAQALVGPNTFGVRYELDAQVLPLASLQDDIRDIVYSGRPAHTLFLNIPFTTLFDGVAVDDVARVAVSLNAAITEEGMTTLSHPLRVDGTWKVGDASYLAYGNIVWDKRLGVAEVGALPSNFEDVSGHLLHNVYDARGVTELLLTTTGTSVALDIYFWNGASFIYLSSQVLTPSTVVTLGLGGLYLAFQVVPTSPNDWVIQIGARRDSIIELVNPVNAPLYGCSLSVGADTVTSTTSEFSTDDVGYELLLEYDIGVVHYEEIVRIHSRTSAAVVDVIDKATGLAYVAPAGTSNATFKFMYQRKWGQTPLIVGGENVSLDPPASTLVGGAYSIELPMDVSIVDV